MRVKSKVCLSFKAFFRMFILVAASHLKVLEPRSEVKTLDSAQNRMVLVRRLSNRAGFFCGSLVAGRIGGKDKPQKGNWKSKRSRS